MEEQIKDMILAITKDLVENKVDIHMVEIQRLLDARSLYCELLESHSSFYEVEDNKINTKQLIEDGIMFVK